MITCYVSPFWAFVSFDHSPIWHNHYNGVVLFINIYFRNMRNVIWFRLFRVFQIDSSFCEHTRLLDMIEHALLSRTKTRDMNSHFTSTQHNRNLVLHTNCCFAYLINSETISFVLFGSVLVIQGLYLTFRLELQMKQNKTKTYVALRNMFK